MTAGTTNFAKTTHSPIEMTMRTSNKRIRLLVIKARLLVHRYSVLNGFGDGSTERNVAGTELEVLKPRQGLALSPLVFDQKTIFVSPQLARAKIVPCSNLQRD